MPEINYLAVLAAAVAAMILGGIWYGPLFSKLWMQGMGWDKLSPEELEQKKKSAAPAYIQQFIGALLTAFVFAHVLWAFGAALPETQGAIGGIQGAIWMWLGFILPVKWSDKIWGGKQFKFVAVDLGYYLVLLLIMGLILNTW